jgi:hypothetical protein
MPTPRPSFDLAGDEPIRMPKIVKVDISRIHAVQIRKPVNKRLERDSGQVLRTTVPDLRSMTKNGFPITSGSSQ